MAGSERDIVINKTSELPSRGSHASSSRKRRRSERPSPLKATSETNSHKITPPNGRRRKVDDASAGALETLAVFSDPSELVSRNCKAPAITTTDSCMLENTRLPLPGVAIDLVSAEAQLQILKQNLLDAEDQLRRERGQQARLERQIRQDMYLEMLQAKASAQRDIEKRDRHLRTASKLIDEKDQAMQELQQRFESTSENLRKNVVELESQRRDLLHLQHMNTTLESDIGELRQIHNEASARKRPPGLPPAYGSLDEEDMPPYELHADSGALNVASLKRVARDKYNKTFEEYDASNTDHALAVDLPNSPDVQRFHQASLALYGAASSLETALGSLRIEMTVETNAKDANTVRRMAAKKSFVLSRAANTILELTWRTIALNEVRPTGRVDYSPRARAVCKTIYSHIDSILVELLRKWNGECQSNSNNLPSSEHQKFSRAAEFQVYLSQITALRATLHELVGRSLDQRAGQFFKMSEEFLREAVEHERMQEAANDARDLEGGVTNRTTLYRQSSMPQEDVNAALHREGSVISSVGVTSESESEEER